MSSMDAMALNITLILTGIAFLFMSALFAKGKGAFLISGYNMAIFRHLASQTKNGVKNLRFFTPRDIHIYTAAKA